MNKFITNSQRVEKLRDRIKVAKPLLPRKYIQLIVELLPEFDNKKGVTIITNVMKFQSTNEEVTKAVEEIVKLNLKSNDKD
jgi:hypothetical protein